MPVLKKVPGLSRTALFTCVCLVLLLGIAAGRSIAGQQNDRRDSAPPGRSGAAVVTSVGPDATTYSISDGDCKIQWIAYTTEANKGVVKHGARCPLQLKQQVPSLAMIMEEYLTRDRNAASFRMLFWGGLVPEAGPDSLEMPLRLALAAHRSSAWDVKRGRPVKGDLNQFVRDLANQEPIYLERKELFGRYYRSISTATVEKVRVMKARDLPFYEELKKQGVQAADRLPFDCMVWFDVSGNVHLPPDRQER